MGLFWTVVVLIDLRANLGSFVRLGFDSRLILLMDRDVPGAVRWIVLV